VHQKKTIFSVASFDCLTQQSSQKTFVKDLFVESVILLKSDDNSLKTPKVKSPRVWKLFSSSEFAISGLKYRRLSLALFFVVVSFTTSVC
jgi:hypothetical protein